MFHVCIAHCMRKSTKCQNVTILVSSCVAIYAFQRASLFGGMDYWNGMVEWNTGVVECLISYII